MIQGYYFIWPLSFVISCRSAYRAICNGRTAHPQARWNIGGNDKRYWPDKIMDYSTTHSLSIHNKQLQKTRLSFSLRLFLYPRITWEWWNTPTEFTKTKSIEIRFCLEILHTKSLQRTSNIFMVTPCISDIKHFYCGGCWFRDLYINPVTTLFLVQELFVNMEKKNYKQRKILSQVWRWGILFGAA